VDSFQGREVDVVLFSCVRAPAAGYGGGGGGIGFLADHRRMNVAITRARLSLVVLGNVRRLSSDANWRALVDHASSRGRLFAEERAGGSGGGSESAEALCARLEAEDGGDSRTREDDPVRVRDSGERDRRRRKGRPGGSDGTRGGASRKSTPGGAQDSGGGGGRDHRRQHSSADSNRGRDLGETEEEEPINPTRDRWPRGSKEGGRDEAAGDRRSRRRGTDATAAAAEGHRSHPGDKTRDRRREEDEVGGETSRRRRSHHQRSVDGARLRKIEGDDDGMGRGRGAPARRAEEAKEAAQVTASGGCGAVSGPKRPRGGADRPPKRSRLVAGPKSTRVDTGPAKHAPAATSVHDGFLGSLLSSLAANADGIASGKEHNFRQGLRGGEVRPKECQAKILNILIFVVGLAIQDCLMRPPFELRAGGYVGPLHQRFARTALLRKCFVRGIYAKSRAIRNDRVFDCFFGTVPTNHPLFRSTGKRTKLGDERRRHRVWAAPASPNSAAH